MKKSLQQQREDREIMKENLSLYLSLLTPIEQKIAEFRYLGDGWIISFGELAKILGVTRQRLQQIDKDIRNKIESFKKRNLLISSK